MRRLIAVLVVIGALTVPAAAQAHIDYYNVTLTGSPWSSTFLSTGYQLTGCWNTIAIGPGQTKYAAHGGSGAPSHWGLAEAFDFSHFHPLNWSDFVTGPETRQFSGQSATLGTRRVWLNPGQGFPYQAGIKFVHQGGSHTVVVRSNC